MLCCATVLRITNLLSCLWALCFNKNQNSGHKSQLLVKGMSCKFLFVTPFATPCLKHTHFIIHKGRSVHGFVYSCLGGSTRQGRLLRCNAISYWNLVREFCWGLASTCTQSTRPHPMLSFYKFEKCPHPNCDNRKWMCAAWSWTGKHHPFITPHDFLGRSGVYVTRTSKRWACKAGWGSLWEMAAPVPAPSKLLPAPFKLCSHHLHTFQT